MRFLKQIVWIGLGVSLWLSVNFEALLDKEQFSLSSGQEVVEAQALPATPIFRYPVVENSGVSAYFDHDSTPQKIVIYDGRRSQPGSGFIFSCPAFDYIAPGAGNAWIGCETGASDEESCSNPQELWYDNHQGIDFEYHHNWHTGASCDPARFEEVGPPVYAPAAGIVDLVEEGDPFNGNSILIYHDLNKDENYYNDGLRSYYLHFANNGIVADEGDLLEAGDLLGYGGMTGLAWTPHLHFEVHLRTAEGWQPVDPFGWTSTVEDDPWNTSNHRLWLSEFQTKTP